MSIKVNADGSFVVDTPEEAMKLQRLILRQKEANAEHPRAEKRLIASNADTRPRGAYTFSPAVTANQSVLSFLNGLKAHEGRTLRASDLMPLLGITNSTAVGPKLRGISTALEQEGVSLDSILRKQKHIDGSTVWKVDLSSAATRSG